MLGFLSFFVVLSVLAGTLALIARTIKDRSKLIMSALAGVPFQRSEAIVLPRRTARQSFPLARSTDRLRAAA